MTKAWLVLCALTSSLLLTTTGCWSDYGDGGYGGGGFRSFEADECNLVSSVTLETPGSPSPTWNACRLRYDDQAQVYTWQFMTPNTTGTWTSQGQSWFTLSFNLNSPQNAALPLSTNAVEEPGWVGTDEVVFAYAPTPGTRIGGTGSVVLGANIIYAGGQGSALDAHLDIDIPTIGAFSGEASAAIGSTPTLTNDASALPTNDAATQQLDAGTTD